MEAWNEQREREIKGTTMRWMVFPFAFGLISMEARIKPNAKRKDLDGLFLFFCLIHAYIVIKQKEQRTNHLSSSLPVILCCVIWRKKGKCNARFLFFISHTTIPISFSLNWIKTKNACFIHFKQRKMGVILCGVPSV